MGKPTALGLAKRTLVDAIIVDVRRRDGEWTIDTFIDQPGFSAGRYVLIPVEDMALTLKRITAAEASAQLTRLMKKHSGRKSPRRP